MIDNDAGRPLAALPEAERSLRLGAMYPFDASDDWMEEAFGPPPPPVDWAHAAARGVVCNLKDRRGVKQGLFNLDEDVRREIVATLADIIRVAALAAPAPDPTP